MAETRLVLVAAMLVTGLAGCTRDPVVGEVFGKVTFKQKPVSEGTITFTNATTGFGAEALLEKDGGYVIKTREGGLLVGDYVVMVNPLIYMDSSDPKTPPSPVEKLAPNIPAKYRGPGTTPLRGKVQQGKNELNYELVP